MLYKIVSGSIEDIPNLKLSCEEVFIMDFGDATFTSFEASTDWITFFEKFPQVDPTRQTQEEKDIWRIGKIHSHHDMSAFHSGVDTQDLVDNAPSLPFFLSLVVNYACTPFAEIAVAGEIEHKSVTRNKWKLNNFLTSDSKIEKKNEKKKVTYIIPCDTFYLTDQWILDQIEVVRERNKPKVYSYKPPSYEFSSPSVSKVGDALHNPEGYRTVIPKLSELLVLGQGTKETINESANVVYAFISHILLPNTIEDYMKAFKYYFINEWYPEHFEETNLTVSKIMICFRHFAKLDSMKDKWLTTYFNKLTYELENEIELLRSVQGLTVV